MIFSRDLLFIHVPKTAGMAVNRFLLRTLPRPVYYHEPDPLSRRLALRVGRAGLVHVPGDRHVTLAEAREIVRAHGFELERFPLVLVGLRNPYELEVSRYAYLQKGYPWDHGYNQVLALNEDFETFALRSGHHAGDERPLDAYFTLGGEFPPNLRILRFERLVPDLQAALESIRLHERVELPEENESLHDDFRSYYTERAEEAVYARYEWAFAQGFYERMRFGHEEPGIARPRPRSSAVHRFPITGAARQVGTSRGLRSEGWVAGSARCRIKTEGRVSAIRIAGDLEGSPDEVRQLVLTVGARESCSSFPCGRSFAWEVGCRIPQGCTLDVELTLLPRKRRHSLLPEGRLSTSGCVDAKLRLTGIHFEKGPVRVPEEDEPLDDDS